MLLTGDFSGRTVGQQCFITEFGDVESYPCAIPATLVRRLGSVAGSGFEPGGQRVAHPGHQKTRRRPCDDTHIHQHRRRVRLLIVHRLENAVLGVQHRAPAARGIGRGDGRDNDHGDIRPIGGDFRCVNGLPATHADQHLHVLLRNNPGQPAQLILATLAAEYFGVDALRLQIEVAFGKHLVVHGGRGQYQPLLA